MLVDYGMRMLEYTLGAADASVAAVSCAASPVATVDGNGRVVDLGAKYAEGVGIQPNASGLLWKCNMGADAAASAASDDSVAITLETSIDEAFSTPITVVELGAILTAGLTANQVMYWGLVGSRLYTIANSTTHGALKGSFQTYLRRYVRTKLVVVSTGADYTAGIVYSELQLWTPNSANRRIFSTPE